MATTVVSGRIDAEEAVTRFIEESGMTWNGVINSLSRYIYEHRSIHGMSPTIASGSAVTRLSST